MHHVHTVAVGDQKRVPGPLELELHVDARDQAWLSEEQFVFFAAKPCFRLSVLL